MLFPWDLSLKGFHGVFHLFLNADLPKAPPQEGGDSSLRCDQEIQPLALDGQRAPPGGVYLRWVSASMPKQRWTRRGRALILVFEGGMGLWKLGFWVEKLAGEQVQSAGPLWEV